jgi:amidase
MNCTRNMRIFGCLLILVASVATQEASAQVRPSFEIVEATIPKLQAALATGLVTSRDLVTMYFARIAAYDQKGPALNAISVTSPRALAEADTLDAERRAGNLRGPLHGIPIVVKDNYETIGMQTADGSSALAGWIPEDDAYLVKKLRAAGAIIIAKTNMHEFAYGILTVGSLFGATRNPYALDRNPGGSSGGTGAAVAANFASIGMGSDTCGSIRIPAFHNSLVGIRGTQGLASRTGIIPLSVLRTSAALLAGLSRTSRSSSMPSWATIPPIRRPLQALAMFQRATPTSSN